MFTDGELKALSYMARPWDGRKQTFYPWSIADRVLYSGNGFYTERKHNQGVALIEGIRAKAPKLISLAYPDKCCRYRLEVPYLLEFFFASAQEQSR